MDTRAKDLVRDIHERVKRLEAMLLCPRCRGKGSIEVTFHGVTEPDECPDCHGTGDRFND